MSLFSTVHDIVALTKDSEAADGQRLSRMIFKTDKDGKKIAESQCVSIPRISQSYVDLSDAGTIKRLIPHIVRILEDGQDGVIRAAFLAGKSRISDADISFDAVMTHLDTVAASDRLTKESLENWFRNVVEDGLMILIGDKLKVSDNPTVEQKRKMETLMNRYRDGISALSGSKTRHGVEFVKSCISVLETCVTDQNDPVLVRIMPRLKKMLEVTADDDLL